MEWEKRHMATIRWWCGALGCVIGVGARVWWWCGVALGLGEVEEGDGLAEICVESKSVLIPSGSSIGENCDGTPIKVDLVDAREFRIEPNKYSGGEDWRKRAKGYIGTKKRNIFSIKMTWREVYIHPVLR